MATRASREVRWWVFVS